MVPAIMLAGVDSLTAIAAESPLTPVAVFVFFAVEITPVRLASSLLQQPVYAAALSHRMLALPPSLRWCTCSTAVLRPACWQLHGSQKLSSLATCKRFTPVPSTPYPLHALHTHFSLCSAILVFG